MTLEAPTNLPEFISSQQTASSETQERIISLGRTLVEELSLDPGVDTLSRWMAHYIAEKITLAEAATGTDKATAEAECFRTILKLWEHRASYRSDIRPFRNFDAVFRVLERLDSEKETPYFYSRDDAANVETSDATKNYLETAEKIDRVARTWLKYALQRATVHATDGEQEKWLAYSFDLDADRDVESIRRLLTLLDSPNGAEPDDEKFLRQRWLKARIAELDYFAEFSQELRTEFADELVMLQADE